MTVRDDPAERMVFWVTSDTAAKKEYKVMLLENQGRGLCMCPDFGVRRQKNLDAGEPAFTRASACKHVVAACLHVCRGSFAAMARAEEQP